MNNYRLQIVFRYALFGIAIAILIFSAWKSPAEFREEQKIFKCHGDPDLNVDGMTYLECEEVRKILNKSTK